MKLNSNFITQDFDNEQIMVSTDTSGFSGLVRSNDTAAFIVNCLKKDTTKEEIVEAVYDKYDANRETIAKSVDEILGKLRSIGALDD